MDNNVDLNAMLQSAQGMLQFAEQLLNNEVPFDNNGKQQFLNKLIPMAPFETVDRNAEQVINAENGRVYSRESIREMLDDINNEDNELFAFTYEAVTELREYVRKIEGRIFDDDIPATAYTAELNNALNNIMAIFNAATELAGGRKRKSAKKSRKSAKKSRKSAKKSRKSTKKSRKSTKKSRKH
jgi:hypothetical protein